MKFCPHCGSGLKPDAKFCTACGTSIAVQTPQVEHSTYQRTDTYQHEPVQPIRPTQTSFGEASTPLLQRVIGILTKPKIEWVVIANEKADTKKLLFGYALILSLIPAIAVFLEMGIIGTRVMGYTLRSIPTGIMQAVVQILSAIIGVYLLAIVIDLLAPSFDSEKNAGRSLQLAVYSSTASWVAGVLMIVPGMKWLAFVGGLYGIYLLVVGMPFVKGTPKDKVAGYVVLTFIAMIAIMLVLSFVLVAVFKVFM